MTKKISLLKIELANLRQRSKPLKTFLRDYSFPKEVSLNGVRFSSVCAKIKSSEKLDLTLIEFGKGSSFSGVFTKSETRSSPVRWCENVLQERKKSQFYVLNILHVKKILYIYELYSRYF